MRSLAIVLTVSSILLSGCLAYPKAYWKTFKGQAQLEDGKPIVIKAQLLKTCESYKGETEKVISERETRTDNQGRYELTIRGTAWNTKNFSSEAGCSSRVQLFICREVCKPVDQIDIDVLGK
ncbi:MAG: hypothetical protein HY077_15285 [Elusimicrobia bacterium]|nr:hypothetical protein [Elusimicrobiota bacterium]